MLIIPAVDIKDKKVVRLWQGNLLLEKIYSDDPVNTAIMWQGKAVKRLHIVDLDGATSGTLKNFDIIKSIRQSTNLSLEVGGGIRDIDAIKDLVDIGIDYVILGTKATDKEFLKQALELYKEKIIVAVDVLAGFVQVEGWLKTSQIPASNYIKDLEELGVRCLMYTDVSRDGTMRGPDLSKIGNLLDITCASIIISGGISSLEDIEEIKKLDGNKNLLGVIIGKALYEGKIDIEQALKLAANS